MLSGKHSQHSQQQEKEIELNFVEHNIENVP